LLRYLVPATAANGFDVRIFSTRERDSAPDLSLLPFFQGFDSAIGWSDYQVTPRLKEALLKERPDLLHVHCVRNYQAEVAAGVCSELGIPLVLQAHGTIPPISLLNASMKTLYDWVKGRKLVHEVTTAIAVSDSEVEDYRKMGISLNRIVKVVQGVDAEQFRPGVEVGTFRNKFGLGNAPLVLCVGRLHKRKGFQHVIRAFANLKSPDAKLVIVGPDYGYGDTLRYLAKRARLESAICFTGAIPSHLLIQAYNAACIAVCPGRMEVFGFTLLEASACGVPSIATDWGAAREIMTSGKTGFLLSSWDNVAQLTELIDWVLSNPTTAKTMGIAARNRICEEYGVGSSVKEFLEVYCASLRRTI
jgi:glycosyltransferase involved in cell wall biosynthesis